MTIGGVMFSLPVSSYQTYKDRANYTSNYLWFDPTAFGLPKSMFSKVLTIREYEQSNDTVVVINTLSAKIKIDFLDSWSDALPGNNKINVFSCYQILFRKNRIANDSSNGGRL